MPPRATVQGSQFGACATSSQLRGASGGLGKPFLPGPGTHLQQTAFFAIDPAAIVVRTAPGPRLSLVLPLLVKQPSANGIYRLEGAATDDYGDEQPFEPLGTLGVRRR